MPRLNISVKDRFWSRVKVDDPNLCWEWQGSRHGHGYGLISINGKIERTHRVSWTFSKGPIPEGVWVLHHCDNPPCVNPAHLYLGDVSENIRDAFRRGAVSQVGERNGNSKLTEPDVLEIRRLYASGLVSQPKLGKMFRVAKSTVNGITSRRRWKHV